MQINNFLHQISPEKVIRGESAWSEGKQFIPSICTKPLLLGRSLSTSNTRKLLAKDLREIGLEVLEEELDYDCCDNDLNKIYLICKQRKCDGIIAAGGGKVLDAGKLIAERANIPCITIPLSASTCAGWTALANIYSAEGAFIRDQILTKCPKLLIFDYSIVRQAPKRMLASGVADALAKWYEASVSTINSTDGLVEQAVQMARVLRDQLLINAPEALKNTKSNSWVKTAEACALTAGIIGGVGGAKCRTAAAHAVHNGLTQLNFKQKPLHGELVGFGILVQLTIEELLSQNKLAIHARSQLHEILMNLELPTNLESLGIPSISEHDLKKACIFACKSNSDIHNLPFKINYKDLINAIVKTEELDFKIKQKKNNNSTVTIS